MTLIRNRHLRWWIHRRNYVTFLHVTNNMLKTSASQLLISSSFQGNILKIPTFCLTPPKILQDVLLRKRTSVFIYLLLTAYFVLVADGIAINRRKMEDTTFYQTTQDVTSSEYMTQGCRDCPSIKHLLSMFKAFNAKDTFLLSKMRFNKFCQMYRMSYHNCNLLFKKFKQSQLPTFEKTEKLDINTRNNTLIRQAGDSRVTASSLDLPRSMNVLSRRKRLASGDRRLVRMHCRTSYVMEIQNDGRVVGSHIKTPNSILEIQSVKPGSIVRFYSPHTGYFLAMNEAGRLYGTKNYSSKNCEFVERIEENMYSTYFSHRLPRDKVRKKRKGGRRTRSITKPWYVAIGKTGKPRKATRIRSPASTAAQFLPQPL